MNTPKMQQGFSLIKLMLIATLGILAYIAIPIYQDYTTKSQWLAGFTEISNGKIVVSKRLNDSVDAVISPTDIGLANVSKNCSEIKASSTPGTGKAIISCQHIGSPGVGGLVTTLTRTTSDVWSCSSTATIPIVAERC